MTAVSTLVDKLVAGGMSAGNAAELVLEAMLEWWSPAPPPLTLRQARNARYYQKRVRGQR